ncbi:MAG TPA: ABC transporter permease, partial [Gemmatimonadales bacterium]|nr:ABC transporter permease [Gemmatimonadales bacterium]
GMILMFSVVLRILPTSGTGTWRNLVMPVATLTLLGAAGLVRLVRGSLLETLDQDFVRTARAKGLRRWGTVGKHAMRNAAIPLLTVFGTQLGALVAGHKKDVVVTPRLDSLPGRVAIYGWQKPDGSVIQPLNTSHTTEHVDYSHGIRFVLDEVMVDGTPHELRMLLRDPLLAGLLSDEGPIR